MGAPAVSIDRREYDAYRALIDEYKLDYHTSAATACKQIDVTSPRRGDPIVWRSITPVLDGFATYHETYPYAVAPAGVLDRGGFALPAHQLADGQHLTLRPPSLQSHPLVIGRSGSGKTIVAQQIAHEAYQQHLNVVTIDAKDDSAYFLTAYPETILLGPRTPVPFLEVPSWLSRVEYEALVIRALRRTWWGGQGTEQVGGESLDATYRKHERPSLTNWLSELVALRQKGLTYTRSDRIDANAAKLDRLTQRYPGISTTSAGTGISLDDLCVKSIYFGFRVHTEVEDFLTNWLVELRFSFHRAKNIREFNTLLVMDESAVLLHEATISETASLAPTFPLLREFGIGCLLTTNNYRSLPNVVRSNVSTHIVLSISDAEERKAIGDTIGLSKRQRAYHAEMPIGQGIVKTSEEWPLPILATIRNTQQPKAITDAEWQAAEERTSRLARSSSLPVKIDTDAAVEAAAREGMTKQPATAQPSPSALHAVAAPLLKKIALNTHAEALLKHAATSGVALTTEAFRDLDLHPQAGTRAKKQLLDLALIEEERITIRRGRGGTAVALRPTASGYERTGIKRRGARGGDSLQHSWLIHALAQRISGACIDALAGAKACDLLIPYNGKKHQQLATFLRITPRDGEFLAIEVEVSSPERGAARNLSSNTAAGIAHTIIATMTPLRRTPPSAMVVDVFELLEAL